LHRDRRSSLHGALPIFLVLLIIFMVTAPIASYPIEVNLPQRSTVPPPLTEPPPPVRLRIDAAGQIFWNDSLYPLSTISNMMLMEDRKSTRLNSSHVKIS